MRFKTSPKYGIGILGTNFGLKVIAPAVINSNHYNLVCVANSSPVMQQRFLPNSRILKLKKSDVLSSPDVDIVWVATPPETHLILVKEALNLGKIVICEKPCGNSTQDVTSLRSLSEELNLPIFVNFEFRYDPIYTHIFAAAKKIHRGHFIRFSVNWKTYAQVQKNKLVNHKNILLDFAIHVLDSFLDFANNIGALFISIEESINKCAICKTNSHLCKQLYLIFDSFSVDIVICRHYTGTGIHEVVMHSENIVINTGIVQPYTSNDFFTLTKVNRIKLRIG